MAAAKVSRSTKSNQQSEVKQDPLTLGQHLAAVLDHPDTPSKIYNGIVDAINELLHRNVCNDSRFIQTVIEKTNELEKQAEAASGLGDHVVVVLTQLGADILGAIKLVQEVTGLNATKARDLVKSIPKDLAADVGQEEAQAIKKQFAEIGCTVRFDKLEGGAQ